MTKKRGLFVGRFQPYHNGHHNALLNALKEVDEIIIVVGSAAQSHTMQNPFTCGERIEMISRALKEKNVFEKCFIIPLEDVNQNELWVSKVMSYTPKFGEVFTNNPLVKQLFEARGLKVKKMVSNQKHIDGKMIREKMLKGNNCEEFIPKSILDYLQKINALERLNAIVEKEEKQ